MYHTPRLACPFSAFLALLHLLPIYHTLNHFPSQALTILNNDE
jgi:hypothetical protein